MKKLQIYLLPIILFLSSAINNSIGQINKTITLNNLVIRKTNPVPTFPNPQFIDTTVTICPHDTIVVSKIKYDYPTFSISGVKKETYDVTEYLNKVNSLPMTIIPPYTVNVEADPGSLNKGISFAVPNITDSIYIYTHLQIEAAADQGPQGHHIIKIGISPIPTTPVVSISPTPNPAIAPGKSVTLQVTNVDPAVDYIWYTNKFNPMQVATGSQFNISSAIADTNFYVIAKQKTGSQCASLLTNIFIPVRGALFIPNVFTPNGSDPANRKFQVKGAVIDEGTMLIYNQWGTLIFQTHDVVNGWDGKVNGKMQPTGVYTYVITGTYVNNQRFTQKGAVNLIN